MVDKTNKLIKNISCYAGMPWYLLLGLFLTFLTFLIFDWLMADPLRMQKIDSYILFSMTETSRYYYVKTAFYNPFVFLNPNAKPLYALISSIFLFMFPFGLFTLKMLNSILAIGTAVVLYKLARKIGHGNFQASIAIIFTLTFPLFFLLSIAAASEILFCFSLVLSAYLLYTKRYFSLVALVSLLPLIRQEGVLYIAICLFFLVRIKKINHIWILPIPLIIWILLNAILLKHSFAYPFFVCADLPGPTPKSNMTSLAELKEFFPLVFYHPIFLLFPIGLAIEMFNRSYMPLLIFLFCHLLFLIITAAMQFLIIKLVSYDFRYIAPLIPFMSIMAVAVLNKAVLSKNVKTVTTILTFIFLITLLIVKIQAIQKNPRVIADDFTQHQERLIKESAEWLNTYLEANKIKKVFYSGDKTTDWRIRRLRLYILPGTIMYPVKEFREVYDPITFKLLDKEFIDPVHKGIVLVLDSVREKELIIDQKTIFLKEFYSVPIYFYKKD